MNLKIASLAIVLTGAASAALGADLSVKAPYAAPVSTFSWSGFYAGLHAGYGWGKNDWAGGVVGDPTTTVSPLSPKTKGVLGGVQAGANYQTGNWVVGVEWEFDLTARRANADGNVAQAGALVLNTTATSSIEWLTQFTGRAGFAVDHTLLYLKAGIAAGEAKDGIVFGAPGVPVAFDAGTKSNLLVGWIGGAGVEHYFAPNWSAKVEYNYVDLGSTTESYSVPVNTVFRETVSHKLQIVKVGANYKF
ncbi:porin family protein [Bradyrhizobium diazoefficiens]|nr:outer membrane beta-barrel protein [Bradyrhizobium diazoefficiens]UCF54781.1 MAG: porin family protein [Bradyrhizobium sp.]MBR0964435.1 porin family protein [Bradyrhizobium diazoefficiens]MBR0978595.1 porin family protein [Bradyrhizobium diazoefficiens]MBR1008145.1 porin family protein [Bradyrhizobium diazoefficiens]MBR1013923.1 porin family protein [Bradyrhizobium diazoefficiens]